MTSFPWIGTWIILTKLSKGGFLVAFNSSGEKIKPKSKQTKNSLKEESLAFKKAPTFTFIGK